MVWSELVLTDIQIKESVERDMRLEARAVRDIEEILDVIGHGVAIRNVSARWFDERWVAAYWRDRKITIKAELMFTDDQMLYVMAHECVHALFLQRDLLEESPPILEYQKFVHETAASVIGAHIAGTVRTRRGGDGRALTERLLVRYRLVCDNFIPLDVIRDSVASADSVDSSPGRPKRAFRAGGYFGTRELIDVIDHICRQNPDPYEAAQVIATTLHNVDEETAKKISIPRDWRPRR